MTRRVNGLLLRDTEGAKRPFLERIMDSVKRYAARFDKPARVVQVWEGAPSVDLAGVEVVVSKLVKKDHFLDREWSDAA